jgi:hypothetical protein
MQSLAQTVTHTLRVIISPVTTPQAIDRASCLVWHLQQISATLQADQVGFLCVENNPIMSVNTYWFDHTRNITLTVIKPT